MHTGKSKINQLTFQETIIFITILEKIGKVVVKAVPNSVK
jgi:uncharacterized membrane protein YcaP (DUF421 family)